MSRKEKATVLYSRNGIKIEKIEFLDMTKWPNMKDVGILIKTTVDQRLKRDSKVEIIPAKKAWKETITRTSKLGFYYYEIKEHKAEPQKILNHDKYDAATMLKSFNYDVYFLGDDHKGKDWENKDLLSTLGKEVIYLPRQHDFSSTNLKIRIVDKEMNINEKVHTNA